MAGMSGVAGNVAMTGCIGGIIKSWTANFTRATTDITGFTNAARNRAIGIQDVTGSLTGSIDDTLMPLLGIASTSATSPVTLTLTAQGGNTIAFLALIDSVTLGVAVDGEATFCCNYAIASTATAYTSAVTTSVWA